MGLETAGSGFLSEIESIYAQITLFFAASGSYLARPPSQHGNPGFAVLYTAPRQRPDLLIVGQNPGNFGPDHRVWDDEPNRIMMSGQVPLLNSYLVHEHKFGRELRRYFKGPNLRLLEECVGLNVWFFQARGTPKPDPGLSAFCKEAARCLVRLIEPRVILCLSRKAFDALRTGRTRVIDDVEGRLDVNSFGAIPIVYAGHPTGRGSRRRAAKSIPAAITWINSIMSAGQEGRLKKADIGAATPTKLPRASTPEVLESPTDIPAWEEKFSPRRFSVAHKAAQHILDTTNGTVSDTELNNFVLAWGAAVGKPLKNTRRQNRNRIIKYRKSWLKHGHCQDMNA